MYSNLGLSFRWTLPLMLVMLFHVGHEDYVSCQDYDNYEDYDILGTSKLLATTKILVMGMMTIVIFINSFEHTLSLIMNDHDHAFVMTLAVKI